MRRFFTGLTVAAVVCALLLAWPRHEKFHVGAPLPPGKVEPQLVVALEMGVLLAPDGSLWAWGGTDFQMTNFFSTPMVTQIPQRIGQDSDWCQVAAVFRHVLALKTDGSLWGWGTNNWGQLGQSNISVRLGTPMRLSDETNWSQIVAGARYSLALKRDGSLWAWGDDRFGELGNGVTLDRFPPIQIGSDQDWQAIASGGVSSFGLKTNGTLWGWGLKAANGPGNLDLSPRQINPGTTWRSFSASGMSVLAVKPDGTLWVGGLKVPFVAPADDITTNGNSAFSQIGKANDWMEVHTGDAGFFARQRNQSWWVGGNNVYGQLGTGNRTPVRSPQRLGFDFEPWAFEASAGYGTTLLLSRDGTLWSWGVRLGAPRPSTRFDGLKRLVNRGLRYLPGHPPLFTFDTRVIDTVPHLVWQLPASMREGLKHQPIGSSNADTQRVAQSAGTSHRPLDRH